MNHFLIFIYFLDLYEMLAKPLNKKNKVIDGIVKFEKHYENFYSLTFLSDNLKLIWVIFFYFYHQKIFFQVIIFINPQHTTNKALHMKKNNLLSYSL